MSNMNGDDRKPKSVVYASFDLSKVKANARRIDGDIVNVIDADKHCPPQVGERVCAKTLGADILKDYGEGERCVIIVECDVIENSFADEPLWYACKAGRLISKETIKPTMANTAFTGKLDSLVNRLATESVNKKGLWLDLINKDNLDPSEPADVKKFNSIFQNIIDSNKIRGTEWLEKWLLGHMNEIETGLKAEFAKPEPQPEPEPTPLPLLDEPSGAMAAAFEKVGLGNGNGNGHSLEAALAEAKAMDAQSNGSDAAIVKKPTAARKKASSKK